MAVVSVPDVLVNLRTQLLARPTIIGPPAVPVHVVKLSDLEEPEQIVFTRVNMVGAGFFRWGAGEGSRATREPLTLSGYVFEELAGNTDADAATALARAGVLLAEIMQQLRDDPTVSNALVAPTRWSPPLMDSALWLMAPAEEEGTATVHIRVDFTISWTATT